jgi:hypothetical protein
MEADQEILSEILSKNLSIPYLSALLRLKVQYSQQIASSSPGGSLLVSGRKEPSIFLELPLREPLKGCGRVTFLLSRFGGNPSDDTRRGGKRDSL